MQSEKKEEKKTISKIRLHLNSKNVCVFLYINISFQSDCLIENGTISFQ